MSNFQSLYFTVTCLRRSRGRMTGGYVAAATVMCAYKGKGKGIYSCLWKSISQLQSVTCRMGSHSVSKLRHLACL